MSPRLLLTIAFATVIVLFLALDLGILNRRAHAITIRSAALQSIFWIAVSLLFAGGIAIFLGQTKALEYMSAYLTEKMLSVDNLFVILLIFSYFKVAECYQHRVLYYGIIGALILRGLFIGLGTMIISLFHWVLYIFGAILIYTGIKLFFEKREEHIEFHNNRIYRLVHHLFRFTSAEHNGHFFLKVDGKWYLSTLFLVVIIVEWTDVVFAIDSLPAAFSISQDPFIVYTSNIFAILGLRAMFFLLEAVIHRFHHLQKGLSFILIAIGAKMLLDIVGIEISSAMSFTIVATCLIGSMLASLAFPKKF
ncbi:MAG: TerC family protein [Candidatus Peribacteraceae bacterium]|nr:TerC family protein [Candidatus Peribacteraceae bacterium]MDD5075024.1 TerC family protein [Candidatus Peribacteraceae bacterium]